MKSQICKRLARMASVAAQDRYITHATLETYYLPEELLDDVASIPFLISKSRSLSADDLKALGEFMQVLNENINPEFLSPGWCTVREAAHKCFLALGGDLLAWESKELPDHSSGS